MASEKKPNIILITFDSGRPDHLSLNGYKRKTTPFLDSLARNGVYFKNAFSTGPGSSVSFVGIFTSTYPLDYGGYSYVDRPRVLFPEALQEAGYTTIGIHSSPYLSGYFGYDKGWDTFRYLNYFKKSADHKAEPMSSGLRRDTMKSKVLKKTSASHKWLREHIPLLAGIFKAAEKSLLFARKLIKDAIHFRPAFFIGEEVNAEVLKALDTLPPKLSSFAPTAKELSKPVFLWVHYLDTHAPYGLFERKGRGLVKKIKYYLSDWVMFLLGDSNGPHRFFMPLHKSIYDDSLEYVDGEIKKLFEVLQERGILNDDSLLIIHSDHGEDFLEHGAFGHPQRLFNVNVKVPLIVYAPAMFKSRQIIERPVSLIDIGPTILNIARVKTPDSFKGGNLFNEDGREVVVQASESAGDLTDCAFTGIAIIRNGYKLIYWKDEKYLYALDDVMERKNLYDSMPEIVRDLRQRVEHYAPQKDSPFFRI